MSFPGGKVVYVLVLAAVACFLGLILIYNDNGLIKLKGLKHELNRIRGENEAILEENSRLVRQLGRLKTDARYIEDEARKKLGLIRSNETIYRLREEPDTPPPGTRQP